MSFPIHLSPVHTERDTYTYAPPSLILQQTYAERPLHMMFPQLNFFSHNRFKSLFEAGVFKDCTMATAFELLCKEPYLDQPTLFTLSAHQYASRFEDAVLFLAREYGSACKNTLKRAAYRMLKRWSESKNDFVQHYLQRCSEARLGDKAWTFAGANRLSSRQRESTATQTPQGIDRFRTPSPGSRALPIAFERDIGKDGKEIGDEEEQENIACTTNTSSAARSNWLQRYSVITDLQVLKSRTVIQHRDAFDMFDKEENAVTIACDAVWKSSPFNFALEKVFPTNVDIGGSDSDSDYYVLPPQQGAIGEVADLGQKSAINDAIKELATSMLMEDRLVFGFAHRLASIVFFNVYTNVFLLPDASELEYRSSIVDSLFEMAFSGTSYMRPRTGPKHDAIVEVILENVRGLKFTAVFAEVVGNPQFQDDAKARRDTKKICKAMASELNVMQQVTEGKKVEKLAVFGIVIHQATYDILAGRIVGGRTVIRKIKSGCFGRVADEWNQWKEVLADMLKIRFRVAFCHNVLRKAASRWTGPAPSLEFTITPSKRRRSSASAVLPAKRARDADNL